MTIKINVLNKRIPIKQIIPVHTQWAHTANFHNEVTFLDFPGQFTINVFKQNLHSEMI